ncbi:MAG: alpha/beta fold hydrolase [Candidatus Binatia bacterium]
MSTAPRDVFIPVNDLRLHVVDWGGTGRAVVIHHATGFHARVYDAIARRLVRHFRVVALDARGHGDSDKPIDGYRWQGFVGDLAGLVEALELRGAIGVGHSLGGSTVAGVASRHPGTFSRAVLLDPILIPREFRNPAREGNPMAEAARRRRDTWPDVETVIASYAARPLFASWRPEVLRSYVEHGFEPTAEGEIRLKCRPEIEAKVFSMGTDLIGMDMISGITVPTLVVRGEHSETFSERDAQGTVTSLRDGRVAVVPDTGHLFPMEAPEKVADLIEGFAA